MYRRPSRPNELYHWGMKKGEKAEDHKYVVRIEDGVTKAGTPKYRYFYSMAEYKAFKEGGVAQKLKNTVNAAVNKVTGNSYKERMKELDTQKNDARKAAESWRKNQRANEREGDYSQATYDRQKANTREDEYNKAVNEKARLKREYESNTLFGKAEKAIRVSGIDKTIAGVQKKVNDTLNSIFKDFGNSTVEAASTPVPKYLQKAPESVSSDPEDYAIKKKEIDPNARSDDNKYTDEEIYKNLHESGAFDQLSDHYEKLLAQQLGIGVDIKDDEDFKEVAAYVETHAPDESLSDIAQREGWIDEKQEGFHPNSFSELNKLEYDLDDDVDQYCVNSDNLNMNKDVGDVDVNGDGYPDVLAQYGYSNNCAYCTLAYEMRQRGYDVEASTCSQMTFNDENAIESWYEGGEFRHPNKAGTASLEKDILKHSPEGSRGQFCLFLANGGGHSVVYEVKNGEVYIRDCQVNKQWKLKDCPYMSRIDRRHPPIYMRTDHLKLTDKSLVGVKNR